MAQADPRHDAETLGRLERVADHRVIVGEREGAAEEKRIEAQSDAAAALDEELRVEPIADLPLADGAVVARQAILGEAALEVDVAGSAAETEEDAGRERGSRRACDEQSQSRAGEPARHSKLPAIRGERE